MTKKQKGFAPLIIIVAVALSIVLGGGIYYSRSKQLKEKPTPTQSAGQLTGWQEYINDRYHYKIKYPPDWFFLKEGYSPPPPTSIMLSNQKEGSHPGTSWVTFSINMDKQLGRSLPAIEEVASLRAQGYDHQKIIMAKEEAVYLFESQGDKERSKSKSIYIIHKDYIYRFVWGGETKELLDQYDEIFQKILGSFTFTD